MCTVTLHVEANALLVAMNRDEYRQRAPELAPERFRGEPDGIAWAGPLDGQSRGTWIGVNERGVVACLLNRYQAHSDASAPSAEPPSRGGIVPRCLERGEARDCLEWLANGFDPSSYDPFTLLVAWPGGGRAYRWDGKDGPLTEPLARGWQMRSSSSWRREEVLAWRRVEFDAWRRAGCPDSGRLPSFHLLQPPGKAEWAPMMAREKTATRSVTRVAVSRSGAAAEIAYWRAPVRDPETPDCRLELALLLADPNAPHPGEGA